MSRPRSGRREGADGSPAPISQESQVQWVYFNRNRAAVDDPSVAVTVVK